MSRAPRVVLDTNVALSALVFAQGRLGALREAWHDARCQPLLFQATAAELMRALAYPKFKLSAEEQQELLGDYLPYCTTVRMPARPPRIPPCRDPFDVPFLQLAIAGKADYLVTGDRDLLSLAGEFSCPIVTAGQFLNELAKV
jgi:putative PIN family toxin of toxin-antitoxin system